MSNPRNVGSRRDFNRLDINGTPPDDLEKKLSELIDNPCHQAIKNIENSREFKGEDRKNILNLIALISVRTPLNREHYNSIEEHLAKVILSMTKSAKEGSTVNGTLITRELKEFIELEQYEINFSRNWQIQRELVVLETVINWLSKRKWILIFSPKDQFFITCDRPTPLYSKTSFTHIYFSGFGLDDRQLFFPLSKRMALIGDLEGAEDIMMTSNEMVAGINSNLLMAAKSQIYAANPDFYFKNSKEEVTYGIEALKKIFQEK